MFYQPQPDGDMLITMDKLFPKLKTPPYFDHWIMRLKLVKVRGKWLIRHYYYRTKERW